MKRLLALSLLTLLAACTLAPESAPPRDETADQAVAWPPYPYRERAAADAVYLLDPARSSIDFVVRREGPLARFGHDHVLSPTALEGWFLAADTPEAVRADLRFPTRELAIDDAPSRARYALDTTPDAEAIAGTRENLLREVLRSEDWPVVTVTLDPAAMTDTGGDVGFSL
ncbi:MAG: hypothetical protein P8Y54_10190, partial [Xanthomonadales bacterium]